MRIGGHISVHVLKFPSFGCPSDIPKRARPIRGDPGMRIQEEDNAPDAVAMVTLHFVAAVQMYESWIKELLSRRIDQIFIY